MNRSDVLCFTNISLLVFSICFGTFALYVHNNLLPFIFFIFALCVIILPARLKKIDETLLISAWVILAMFPVPFLLYYQDAVLAIVYVALFWAWFLFNRGVDCSRCDIAWCGIRKLKGNK